MKSDRGFKFAVSILIAILIVVFFRVSHRKPVSDENVGLSPAPESTPSIAPSAGVSGSTGLTGTSAAIVPPTARSAPSLIELAPPIARTRAEVAKNPHVTPPSVVRFGMEIGRRMDQATTSESAAALFNELSDCVRSDRLKESRVNQAICLSSAKRLSEIHPELAERAQGLAESADPEVVRIAK